VSYANMAELIEIQLGIAELGGRPGNMGVCGRLKSIVKHRILG